MNTFRIFAKENQIITTEALCQFIDELADIGSLATPVILSALKDPSAQVRGFAARALGRLALDTPAVADGLSLMLKDDDTYARQCAAAALGSIQPCSLNAILALKAALEDKDSSVRLFASECLKHTPSFASVYPFDQAKQTRFNSSGEYCSVAFG